MEEKPILTEEGLRFKKVCPICDTVFYVLPSQNKRRKHCSVGCRGLAKRGKNSPVWKGGNSRAYKQGYYTKDYKDWRISVFTRDRFTCVNCGETHTYLTAHHIKSFAHYPELRFDVNNGMTLCEECHSKTDNYKGRNKNVY